MRKLYIRQHVLRSRQVSTCDALSVSPDGDHEETVKNLFKQCAVGKVLDNVLDESNYEEYLELYIHDFIKMMYKCESGEPAIEYQVIIV